MRSATIAILLCIASNASAHFHILLPDKHSIKSGDEVTLTYMFGHSFEHQMFDAAAPASAKIHGPDGNVEDIKAKLKKIMIPGEGKKMVSAYQYAFKPEKRGDYTIVFVSPQTMHEGEKIPFFDTSKVVVHVQTQNGWDAYTEHYPAQAVDLVPLTRPYGLRPGMLFRSTFLDREKSDMLPNPIGGAEVEIERYNATPPKMLPADEHITYTVRTDSQGVLASVLPDPGWWSITASKATPKAIHRCTFWVYVDDKPK